MKHRTKLNSTLSLSQRCRREDRDLCNREAIIRRVGQEERGEDRTSREGDAENGVRGERNEARKGKKGEKEMREERTDEEKDGWGSREAIQ